MRLRHLIKYTSYLLLAVMLLSMAGCSTQKNTARSRWWHSFNARYNTYYNGSLAYIDGSLEKENGHKDNFTELLPLYPVGNKNSRELGKGNFDRAIEKSKKAIKLHSIKRRPEWPPGKQKTEKDREWLSRKEYNPFLWKAWMLMGRSQFHSGAFDEAASTFAYMSRLYQTQPSIYGRARAWLAKSYIEQDWMYDAEDVIRNMERDSIHWRAQKEWDYTYTSYYIHHKEYQKAIPYLRKVIKHEMRRKQKARQWFLLGQLHEALGQKEDAYKAYQHVLRQHPPYEVEFNARIAMTEVMAGTQAKKMVSKLQRMAANDNNKDYLDQVYYAIGNIHLAQRDTLKAISAYEKGNQKATRAGIEKGVLLLKLGDLYWQREKYNDAQRCYGEAIGLLDKEREDYEELAYRSKVLDELVPYTDAVQLQDSLQTLAKLPEAQRNAAIDRVIEALKKKEKEEADLLAEQNAQNGMSGNNEPLFDRQTPTSNRPTPMTQNPDQGLWYFYNQMAVNQGKTAFQRLWGKRDNVDNWQRVNKTIVAMEQQNEAETLALDSLEQANALSDSLASIAESDEQDPHKREYYLAQIPFTPEQIEASNLLIMDGLYHSGVIFKDKLDNLQLSEKALRRLVDMYPAYNDIDQAYYHLFLLYSRLHQPGIANSYIQRLKAQHPNSKWTVLLTDPHFKENAVLGTHIEDSLYAATYDAFKANRHNEVHTNAQWSERRFPLGANRDKFLFIGGLSKLNSGNADGCLADMQLLVEKYPESSLSHMAGMIINGVQSGRRLRGGKFDMGDVWSRRTAVLSDSDSIAARQFSNERNTDFTFMIAYHPDSVNENQLLYHVAKYNFTSYMVRNFDVAIEQDGAGLHLMKIAGFRNFDEALQYARAFYRQSSITSLLGKARSFVISDTNLELLGTTFSYDDYDKYYTKHFAPLKVSTFQLLTEPVDVQTIPQKKPAIEDIDRLLDDGTFIDNGLDAKPTDNSTIIVPQDDMPEDNNQGGIIIPTEDVRPQQNTGTTIIPNEPPVVPQPQIQPQVPTIPTVPTVPPSKPTQPVQKQPVKTEPQPIGTPIDQGATVIPVERPATPATPTDRGGIIIPNTQPTQPTKATQPTAKGQTKAQPSTVPNKAQPQNKGGTIIYFENDKNGKNQNTPKPLPKAADKQTKQKKKAEPKTVDFGDEYYDLEGF